MVRILLGLFAGALIALLTIVVLMTYTDVGRRTTARVGFWTAGQITGVRLGCGGFSGSLFSAFICTDFAVSDRMGVFLTGRELALDWRFAPLWSRRLSVDQIRLTDSVMTREPDTGPDDDEPFRLLPDWPNAKIEIARLNLERFTLRFEGKPPLCFGGGGSVTITEPTLGIDTAFARCGGEGSLRAVANYQGGALTIDTRAVDDGTVAEFLFGWDGAGATDLRIAGNGPLEAFMGTLDANVTDGGEAHFQLNTVSIGMGGDIDLRASGRVVLAEGRAPSWAPARDGEVSLRMVATNGGGIRAEEGMVRWGGSNLNFQFAVEATTHRLSGQIDAALANLAGFDTAVGSAVLQGTQESPAAQLTYTVNGLDAGELTAAELDGRATLALENGLERIRFASQGTADTLRIADIIDSAIGGQTSFDVSGNYITADEALDIAGNARGEHVRLTFDADLGFENGLSGTANAEMFIAETGEILGIHITGGGTFRLALTGLGAAGETGTLALESPMLDVDGNFRIAPGGETVGNFRSTRIDPERLSRSLNWQFTGAPSLTASVTGRLAEPVMAFEIEAPRVSRGFFTLTDARGQVGVARDAERLWHADTKIVSPSSMGPLNLDADLSWGGGGPVRALLDPTTLAGAPVAGQATAILWRGPWTGEVVVRERPLAPLAALAGQEMTSAGTITIRLSPEGEQQKLDAAVAVTRIRSGTALINASLNGSVGYNLETEALAADLALTDIDDRLRLVAGGTAGDQTQLTLRTLEGRWTNMPIRLLEPAEIRSGGGRILLTPAVLDVSGGRLELSGEQAGTTLTARANLAALPVGPLAVVFDWPADAEGRIDGTAEVTFAQDSARGRVVVTANDLAFAGQERGLEPADLSLAADWDGRMLNITGQITGLDSAPAVLSGSMPLVREPGSFAVDIPEHGPVTGSFTAVARAERLFALLPLPEHRLAGALSVSLAVSGDIAQPDISGRALLENATYESLELGTRLEALHLALEATPDGALALAANASDGGNGRFSLNGRVALVGARATVTAQLETVDADLARTDEYVARGSVTLAIVRGMEGPVRVTGMGRTTEVRFDLGQPLPQGVEEIAVVELNRPPGLVLFEADQGPEVLRTAQLEIDIDMPNRVFVTGYGVNAEWRGNVNVRGTLGDPLFQGALTLVRGEAEVLGREFELEQGLVTIDPLAPGNARIRIIGAHRTPGFTVRVTADGTPAQPRLEWSSTPVLPRDEILARLYFGRASPSLSAYEAVQLAQLSGVISGFGGTGGVLGFARRLVGLDVLRVDAPVAGAEGGPRLAVGKYITDRIYVGAVSGADTSSGAVQIEVEITPNITVQAETGANAKNSVGVNWERDY